MDFASESRKGAIQASARQWSHLMGCLGKGPFQAHVIIGRISVFVALTLIPHLLLAVDWGLPSVPRQGNSSKPVRETVSL